MMDNDTQPQEITEPRMNTITAIYTRDASNDADPLDAEFKPYHLKNPDVIEAKALKEINDYCLGLTYDCIEIQEVY